MDNFIDKLAHKFSAQEMIRANSQAEAEEMKRLKLQVSEYEKILQEIRKLNYKNAELSERFELMIGDNAGKIQDMKEDEGRLIAALKDITEEQTRNREAELARIDEERLEREQTGAEQKESDIALITELLEDKFRRSDDFVHKENVKVYRNIQAVVVDEVKRSMEKAQSDNEELKGILREGLAGSLDGFKKELDRKINRAVAYSVISMIASVFVVLLWALMAFGFTTH